MNEINYYELMKLSKDYIDSVDALYKLRTYNEDEINNIYNVIKKNLIETKILLSSQIIEILSVASKYNNRYFKSYWILFLKIIEDNKSVELNYKSAFFQYFYYRKYGNVLNKDTIQYFEKYDSRKYSLDVHDEDSIYRAIMFDDIESFVVISERNGLDINKEIDSDFYPISPISILEM